MKWFGMGQGVSYVNTCECISMRARGNRKDIRARIMDKSDANYPTVRQLALIN